MGKKCRICMRVMKMRTIEEAVRFVKENCRLLGWKDSDGGCDIWLEDNGGAVVSVEYNPKKSLKSIRKVSLIFKEFFGAKSAEIITIKPKKKVIG